jgi:putative transposase
MGQSLTHLLVHAIFSKKDRRPFLRSEEIRNEIYAYMAGILKNLDCHPIKIGGVVDHVHVFSSLFSGRIPVGTLPRAKALWAILSDHFMV